MEPVARGLTDPDTALLAQAVAIGGRVHGLPASEVPRSLRHAVDAVHAVAAAYSGHPSDALAILERSALPGVFVAAEEQLVTLAAVHAHRLVGSLTVARAVDDAATPPPPTLPHLMLDVCRARERLALEATAGGCDPDTAVVPTLHRLTNLLVRLGWQGLDLVSQTALQALEHQALRAESRTDALTGVGNRRALDEELRAMVRFTPLPMSLILVDVDDFKRVNDHFTHMIGDEVLRRVAGALQRRLRAGDKLVRYGGDEFVVLLPHTGEDDARMVADRMAEGIYALPWFEVCEGLQVRVTTGCAALRSLTSRRPDRDAERLLRRADEDLLAAKQARY
jgi:diguanylate cyclase (GGDEF)-like protein